MPDDQYRVLARAIRGPMHRWWLRVGLWWLLVMVIGQTSLISSYLIKAHMPLGHYSSIANLTALITFFIGNASFLILPAALWLAAAWTCLGNLRDALRDLPIPDSRRLDQLAFRLCYGQGLWPLGLSIAGVICYMLLAGWAGPKSFDANFPVSMVTQGGIYQVFLVAGAMAWATGILVSTNRIRFALIWALAWWTPYIAIHLFQPAFSWYPTSLKLPIDPQICGAALLMLLILVVWRCWWKVLVPVYALCIAAAASQIWLIRGLLVPLALTRNHRLHALLLWSYDVYSTGSLPRTEFFGPADVTGGFGLIDISFMSYNWSPSDYSLNYWLLLGMIILVNLALIAVQFLLIDWVLGNRVKP